MFPFDSRWRWLFNSGYAHIVEATKGQIDVFQEPYKDILEDRARKMQGALRARGFVFVFLNLGVFATVVAWFAHLLPGLGDVSLAVSTVARSLTGISLLFTALWLLLTRYLGQLQADMVSSMALGTPGAPELSPEEEARLERAEKRSRRRGWIPNPLNRFRKPRDDEE